ncbi:hypothetical protein PENTCL1PPCAC_2923 [Pristionchus entomophagus]|uniref:G-protein coupled receptors family 1 profile domain-containing protein n=1 Tax=Pristionchus entomophagus TaxID=358040 RepID=A0AAV5SCI9_9BILA|nr:hypothetical protein PENTCL1PPCAC_2923 [Pristionchus entomophagus]
MNSTLFEITDRVIGNFLMVLVAVTIPVNILVTTILFKNRRHHSMNNVYFQIYSVGSCLDLIAMVNNYFGSIFPARGWFLEFYLGTTTPSKIFLILAWGTRFGQEFTSFLISINRASAVVFPLRYDDIWNQYSRVICVLIQIVPGIVTGSMVAFADIYWKQKQGNWYIQFSNKNLRSCLFTYVAISQTGIVIAISCCYAVLIYFFKARFRSLSEAARERNKQEQQLIYISLIVCSMEFLNFFFFVYVFAINTKVETRVFYFFYNAINDIYSATPPYLLIIFCTPVRERVMALFHLRERQKTELLSTF